MKKLTLCCVLLLSVWSCKKTEDTTVSKSPERLFLEEYIKEGTISILQKKVRDISEEQWRYDMPVTKTSEIYEIEVELGEDKDEVIVYILTDLNKKFITEASLKENYEDLGGGFYGEYDGVITVRDQVVIMSDTREELEDFLVDNTTNEQMVENHLSLGSKDVKITSKKNTKDLFMGLSYKLYFLKESPLFNDMITTIGYDLWVEDKSLFGTVDFSIFVDRELNFMSPTLTTIPQNNISFIQVPDELFIHAYKEFNEYIEKDKYLLVENSQLNNEYSQLGNELIYDIFNNLTGEFLFPLDSKKETFSFGTLGIMTRNDIDNLSDVTKEPVEQIDTLITIGGLYGDTEKYVLKDNQIQYLDKTKEAYYYNSYSYSINGGSYYSDGIINGSYLVEVPWNIELERLETDMIELLVEPIY